MNTRQKQFDNTFMRIALEMSTLSYCKKRKVGCVITMNNHSISSGYNGTAPGKCNICEDIKGDTLPEVRHAEVNAIACLDKDLSLYCATLYCTLAPCKACAELIHSRGITKVFYNSASSKGLEGLGYLRHAEIYTEQITVQRKENDV